jgi:hypothetical protein
MRRFTAGLVLVLLAVVGRPVKAQTAGSAPTDALRVFLDCQFECDSQYLRTEINYVNWVLDRTVSDVHLLVSSEETGGGGRKLTLRFIGQRRFQGVDDELVHITQSTASQDDRRRGIAQVIKLGLVRYLARTPDGARLAVTMPEAAPSAAQGTGLKPRDPWHNWVFTTSANTFLNGESQQRFSNFRGEIGASKVTDKW